MTQSAGWHLTLLAKLMSAALSMLKLEQHLITSALTICKELSSKSPRRAITAYSTLELQPGLGVKLVVRGFVDKPCPALELACERGSRAGGTGDGRAGGAGDGRAGGADDGRAAVAADCNGRQVAPLAAWELAGCTVEGCSQF